MLSTLHELGVLSARYAEEEAKQRVTLGSTSTSLPTPTSSVDASVQPSSLEQTSTLVSAPMPPVAALQRAGLKSSISPAAAATVSSPNSLPASPVLSNSPPNSNSDYPLPAAMLPLLTQRASLPGADKLQQLGLSLLPLGTPFQSVIPPSQAVLVQTPFGLTSIPALSAAAVLAGSRSSYLPAPPQPQSQNVAVFSSLQSSRMRKPFHKRRPAHMDKSMLFCHFCGRKETPEWRKGPAGPATLCNACGLQWAKKVRAQRNSTASRSSTTSSVQDVPESVAATSETASTIAKEAVTDTIKQENLTTA